MDATAYSGADGRRPDSRSGFGAGRLFIADSRLAFGVVNYARHRAFARVFGVQGEEANLLTLVLVLTAGPPTAAALWRAVRAPLAVATGLNAAVGGVAVRTATRGIAGPGVSQVPNVEALLALAVVGGLAVPQLRRAVRGVRAAEHRVRQQREGMYNTARSAMRRD
jgi:hypothetical protein